MTRRHILTGKQHVIVSRILDTRLHATDQQNLFRYEEGWDDDRVAVEAEKQNQEKDKPIVAEQVGRFRARAYGNVKRAAGTGEKKPTARLKAEIDELRGKLAELDHAYDDMEKAYNKLAEWARAASEKIDKMEQHLSHRAGYVPPPGKKISTPPSNGSLV